MAMNSCTFEQVRTGAIDPTTGSKAIFKLDTNQTNKQEGVGTLQDYLLAIGWKGKAVLGSTADLSKDKIFGPTTEKAVKAFQKECNLTVDGIVGQTTAQKLKDAYSDGFFTNQAYWPIAAANWTYSNVPAGDVHILARVIAAEHGYVTGTGDTDARNGIARVIKNRYNGGTRLSGISYYTSSGTLLWKDVVFASGQFSVCTGSATSKELAHFVKRGTAAWQEAVALAGTITYGQNPTKGTNVSGQRFFKGDSLYTASDSSRAGYCRYPTSGTKFTFFYN